MQKISHDSEILAEGQQVITACALIHQKFAGDVKFFLAKRADSKKFLPGVYEIPGGHIDFAEDIVSGLKREIMEEFEIDIAIGQPFYAFTYVNQIKKAHAVEIIYFAKLLSPISQIKIHPEDHSEYIWITEKDIAKVTNVNKGADDHEIIALKKAFKFITMGEFNFG